MEFRKFASILLTAGLLASAGAYAGNQEHTSKHYNKKPVKQKLINAAKVQLGPRPFFLVNDMDEGELKEKLQSCSKGPFYKKEWSIGHRGAPLQFPEHTKESYVAAAKMGAGVLECDVAFTKDRELVCRHSQCDLHTTTNMLATPLASKCSETFQPAQYDSAGNLITPASASCCTSDITLAEFKSLEGKMDAGNTAATTVEEYMDATPAYRTDLYATRGTLMSHKDSIRLFRELGVKMTPELKYPSVEMPFDGDYTQEAYAQQLINEYKELGVSPKRVFPQSFYLPDVLYWINNEPMFGYQGVYLDGRDSEPDFDIRNPEALTPTMDELAASGVQILAPPIFMLLDLDSYGEIVPSAYALAAKAAGLKIIAWSLERSGPLTTGGGYYYSSVADAINNDGDMMKVLDVLAKDVGVMAVFSDWPATTTYYANCMNLD